VIAEPRELRTDRKAAAIDDRQDEFVSTKLVRTLSELAARLPRKEIHAKSAGERERRDDGEGCPPIPPVAVLLRQSAAIVRKTA
jgi:hypothetical protein